MFITLTRVLPTSLETKVLINTDQIVWVQSIPSGSMIFLTSGPTVAVTETPEAIATTLNDKK